VEKTELKKDSVEGKALKKNVMLSLSKHLYRIAELVTLAARARCFGKLNMTFFFQPSRIS
jgi:hypothetical protein